MPGLIDIHTHTSRTKEGPGLVLSDGVTGWIDAGSQGADRIGDTVAVARTSPQQGRVLINIGRAGILPDGDTLNIARADTGALREAIATHRDASPASRRGCRRGWRARTMTRCCGARRR